MTVLFADDHLSCLPFSIPSGLASLGARASGSFRGPRTGGSPSTRGGEPAGAAPRRNRGAGWLARALRDPRPGLPGRPLRDPVPGTPRPVPRGSGARG